MEEKKSILLFGNYPPPFGGVPYHIKHFSQYLTEHGWHVIILSMSDNNSLYSKNEKINDNLFVYKPSKLLEVLYFFKSIQSSLKIFFELADEYIKISRLKLLVSMIGSASYVNFLCTKHDIKLMSSYHILKASAICSLIARNQNIPHIATVFGEIYSNKDLFLQLPKTLKIINENTNLWSSCSQHCFNSIDILPFENIKGKPVLYGVEIPDNQSNKNLEPFSKNKNFLYVGRMVYEMGLHILLDAFQKLLSTHNYVTLTIVGKTGELTVKAQELQSKYPNNIFIITNAKDSDLEEAYIKTHYVIVPSINERACLGLAGLDAMKYGKVLLISDIGGSREIASEENAFFFKPNNVESLVNTIEKTLALKKEDFEKFYNINTQHVKNKFDMNIAHKQIEQLFLKLIDNTK